MKSLPANLVLEKHKVATSSAWLVLLRIELTNGTKFRLARNNEDVVLRRGTFAADPTLFLKLNDNASSATVEDSSGNGNDGTAQRSTSAMATPGKISSALYFDGDSDYVTVPTSATLGADFFRGDEWTIAFWVKADLSGDALQDIFSGTTYEPRIMLNRDYGTLQFGAYISSNYVELLNAVGAIADTNWHHVVITADPDNYTMYIDGVQVAQEAYQQIDGGATSYRLGDSGWGGGSTRAYKGALDCLLVFDRTLTRADIDYLYNAGRGTETLSLISDDDYSDAECVGHWKLNDNAASTTVSDSSGNSNNGTAQQNTANMSQHGKLHRALYFDGASDYVAIPTSTSLPATLFGGTNWTVALWLKPDLAGDELQDIFATTTYLPRLWFAKGTGNLIFSGYIGGAHTNLLTASGAVADGNWHHVVVTSDGSRYRMYVDGAEADSTPYVQLDSSGATEYRLGDSGWGGGSVRAYRGLLDDVRIFTRAWSAAEVSHYYNGGDGTESLGIPYIAFNFELDPMRSSGRDELPTLELRVANVTRLLESDLQALDGGLGSTVNILVVNSDLLYEDYSELDMEFEVLACDSTAKWIVFTLGAPSPLRQRFPRDTFLALHCRYVANFKGAECGYSGAETSCDGTLATCREYGNSERFGGFPGMRSGSVRIA